MIVGLALIAILAIGVYWFGLRGSTTQDAQARAVHAVAQIGEGKTVILVGDNGTPDWATPPARSPTCRSCR